jgi:hypothetical protein
MGLWSDIATWRGPVKHHSGTIADHMYVVVHTADGSYEGTIAWQQSDESDNSSHFVVDFDGKIAQVNDTANRSGAQKAGNPYSIAIENAGHEYTPLTAAQIEANARILAKAHQVYGIPLQLTGRVGTRGLGHHSMGAESGVDWGHDQCPGNIIKGQKPAILARAKEIVAGVSAQGAFMAALTDQQQLDMYLNVKQANALVNGLAQLLDTINVPNGNFLGADPSKPTSSPIHNSMKDAIVASGAPLDPQVFAAAVVAALPAGSTDSAVVEAAVLKVLQSTAGQAALVQAGNTAEDS